MKKKLIKWSIRIFITCFVVYGFIYHTFVMFLILFILVGLGYGIVKHGKKLIDKMNEIKKT